jgi:XTP/dITP diphosphohydrolase
LKGVNLKNILFATGNNGKAKEVKKIFAGSNYNVLSLYDISENDEIIEDCETFEENAFIKAKYIYDKYKVPVIADDSGLSVDQLDGRPGVLSARYAGEKCTYDDNNNKLIDELKFFDEPHPAKFICCAVYYDGKNKISETGELTGKIINEKQGSQGFGYDPIFVPEYSELTLAEMELNDKNTISHRGKAFNKLKESLIKKKI